jgi:hypothetical protein
MPTDLRHTIEAGCGAQSLDCDARKSVLQGGNQMSKGDKKRGNREAKKPKKVKEKTPATADFNRGKGTPLLGEKKAK